MLTALYNVMSAMMMPNAGSSLVQPSGASATATIVARFAPTSLT